jgi:CHASE2 domain-containing sensor protein
MAVWRRGERPTALLLLAASSLLVCVIFFPQERFRIPVIDPALIVCAAGIASIKK